MTRPYPIVPPWDQQTGDLVVFYTGYDECYKILHRPTGVTVSVPTWELFPMDGPAPKTQAEALDRLTKLAAAALLKLGKGLIVKAPLAEPGVAMVLFK